MRFTVNINQHFLNLAQAEGANASQLITQRERLFKDKVMPELIKRKANETAILDARSKWFKQTDQVMIGAGLLPKDGQSSQSFKKDQRAERAINQATKTGSKLPIIKESARTFGDNVGNMFSQGVGSTIEGLAGFVRDIGENETDSIAAKTAKYGQKVRKGYENSASTFQKGLQAGESGKAAQLASGAIQSVPAMALPFAAAKGLSAAASKIPLIASKAPYVGLAGGKVAEHSQNYGEVRRNATANLQRDFPTWEKLQGNPTYEKNFQQIFDSGVGINQARKQAHAKTLDDLSEGAADKYGTAMTAIGFIAPSGATLGSGILKNLPNSKIGKALVGGGVSADLVRREINQAPRIGIAKLIPDLGKTANIAAAKMVGKQALEEGLQGGIGEYGAQAATANIGGQAVDYSKVGKTILEEGLIGGIMGGGMQSASGGSATSQAKDIASNLRNQTNRLHQEEATARQELASATQYNNPEQIQSAQANLQNIGAEANKVKQAYQQYGIDVPHFVDRFSNQYTPQEQQQQQQQEAAIDPEATPVTEDQPQPTPTPVNQGMADTTNIVMDSVTKGILTPEEAQAIQSDPIHADVFSLATKGDEVAAYNVVMNAVSLGNLSADQAQTLIEAIPRYKKGQKPTVSSIVDNHVKQQVQPAPLDDGGEFSNAIDLDPNTLEPIDSSQPSPLQDDISQPQQFADQAKAYDYLNSNGLQDSHEMSMLQDGTIDVRPRKNIIPDDPNLNDFGYSPKDNLQQISEDPNLTDFSEGEASVADFTGDAIPEVLPVQEEQPAAEPATSSKQDFSKPKIFSSYIKTKQYMTENQLQDSHEIIKLEDGRAKVQLKSTAEELAATETPENNSQPLSHGQKVSKDVDKLFEIMGDGATNAFTIRAAELLEKGENQTYSKKASIEAALKNPNYNIQHNADGSVTVIGVKRPDNGKWIGVNPNEKAETKEKETVIETPDNNLTFPEMFRDAHINNPSKKLRLINNEVNKGRLRSDVLKEASEIVKSIGNQIQSIEPAAKPAPEVTAEPKIEAPKTPEVITENKPKEQKATNNGMLENDIGRLSDNQPFANKSAANNALKTQKIESTHEVLQLSPSQFILREKQDEPKATNTSADQNDIAVQATNNGMLENILKDIQHSESGIIPSIPSELMDQVRKLEDILNDLSNLKKDEAGPNALYDKELLTKLAKLNPDARMHIVSDLVNSSNPIVQTISDQLQEGGFYSIDSGISYIYPRSSEWKGTLLELINHELIHAVTQEYIDTNKLTPKQLESLDELKEVIWNNNRESVDDIDPDALDRINYAIFTSYPHEMFTVFGAESVSREILSQIGILDKFDTIFNNVLKEAANDYGKIKQRSSGRVNEEGASKGVSDNAFKIPATIPTIRTATSSGENIERSPSNQPASLSSAEENQGALKIGDTIIFSEVFDYALPNESYTIITSSKAKLTVQTEGGSQFSFKPDILAIEKAKNPDLYKTDTAKVDSKGKQFSRSEDLTQAPDHAKDAQKGPTPAQVRTQLVNRFGDDVIQQLEQKGILTIAATHSEQGIEGFAENGRVTLVADAITAENIIPVFLHELGGHIGMQGVMKPAAYQVLMKEFNRLVKSGNTEALEAKRLAERETNAEVQADEYLPYLITVAAQNQAKQGPVQRLISRVLGAVKAWAVDKLGLNLKLNPSDILALAKRMVKTVAKNPPPTPPKGKLKTDQTETEAFKKWFGDSKVIDESGKPKIVYHGTNQSFNIFNVSDVGIHAGTMDQAQSRKEEKSAGQFNVMPLYMRINNPLRLKDSPSWKDPAFYIQKTGIAQYLSAPLVKRITGFYDELKGIDLKSAQGQEQALELAMGINRRVTKELKAQGYDGIVYKNTHDGTSLENKMREDDAWIVFDPEQIKSAINNNGDFDSSNPDIRYSRTDNPENDSRSRQREFLDSAAKSAFGQMSLRGAEGAKTLSKRTLNLFQTMLHKSLNDKSGEFKRTFDLVQNKINHVTFASSKSMDVAPNVLTQLEAGSDYWKEAKRVGRTLGHSLPFSKIEKAKIDTDLEKVGKLMFENTLLEDSERHTEKELRKLGFDEDQIKIYNEIREAIDTSLDTFANTTFSNIYKHLGGTDKEILDLAAKDLDIHDHYNAILKLIDNLTKDVPEKADARQAAIEAIDKVLKKANDLKDNGYVPLMRFGKYFVRIFNPATGEVAYRQHFESESERNIFFNNYDKESLPAGYEIEQSQINELEHKLFQGVSPETVALFAKESGLPIGDAETAYIKYAVKNNHALKRLLRRQGIDGFDSDVKRVLAAFVLSNARYSANQIYNPAIDESITDIKDPAYQEDAIRLRDYALDTQEELAPIKNFAFVYYMGFSAMFGLVNLTQPILQTLPYLMQYSTDHATIPKAFLKAIQTWRKGTDTMDQVYKADYERARKEGHLDPQNTWMMQGLERGKSGLGASTWQLISHSSGLFAQASETVNRRTTLFAALDVAKSLGQEKLEKLGFKDSYDFAVRAIQETQGIYNKGNRPRVARGNIGSVLMMYKQFMISYIEQMSRMQKSGLYGGEDDQFKKKMAKLVGFGISRSVLVALGMLMSFSGATGLPFMRDILDAIETTGGLIGKPINTEREVQIALHDALGQTLGSAVNTALMDGFVNLNPVMDVKGRMGMGDLIPATAYFSPTTSEYMKSSELSNIAGPMGGLLEKLKESVGLAQVGAYGQAGVQLLPKAATSLGQGVIAATTGDYRNMKTGVKTNDATVLDGIIKTLDAQPATIAKEGRVRGLEMKDKAAQAYNNKRWKEGYDKALESGDRMSIRDIQQKIVEYNKDDPRYPVNFNQKTAETNFKKSNQNWQEKRKNKKGLEWMDEYNEFI